ncbi:MAG: 50S ribosomal protein L13 [Patescibacteria group bacterium]|jgi:large subunit ribosomal protein L13
MARTTVKKSKTVTLDAAGQSVGRLATEVSQLLQGKRDPGYEPRIDSGVAVEVKNISKLKFTGKKLDQKIYYHYSGYPGGMRERQLKDVLARSPAEVLRRTVWNMLPKNRQRKDRMKRLTVAKE